MIPNCYRRNLRIGARPATSKRFTIQPGNPQQNGFTERFNGTFRREFLDAYLFESISQVREMAWFGQMDYNEEHPHESLGNLPPAIYRAELESSNLQLLNDREVDAWQNGTTENFNGKFCDECLAMEWFRNRLEAKVVIEDWWQHYNKVRPHFGWNYQISEAFGRKAEMTLSTRAIPN